METLLRAGGVGRLHGGCGAVSRRRKQRAPDGGAGGGVCVSFAGCTDDQI